jgi:hypothetical protein
MIAYASKESGTRALPSCGRNSEYGTLEPTIRKASQPIIFCEARASGTTIVGSHWKRDRVSRSAVPSDSGAAA